jgi:hypothetical protein
MMRPSMLVTAGGFWRRQSKDLAADHQSIGSGASSASCSRQN